MKTQSCLVVALCLVGWLSSPGFGDTTPYSTDFSADPGWVTDQPANYYWDGPSQTYHVRGENHSPGYAPSRYAYKLLPESASSFRLQWDINVARCDWSAGTFFGVMDNNLLTSGWPGAQSIQAGPGIADGGRFWSLYVQGPSVVMNAASSYDNPWDLGEWYTCTLVYDAGTNMVDFDVRARGSATPIWTVALTVFGGSFTHELRYLGTTRGGIGDSGSYPGLSPWAVAEGYIDNVSLAPLLAVATINIEPDTLSLKNAGKWITCHIELGEEYDVADIDVSTVRLNGQVAAESQPTAIGDYDDDGVADLMVKFDRSAVQKILEVGDAVEVTVTGQLTDGTPFEGSDTIRVISQGDTVYCPATGHYYELVEAPGITWTAARDAAAQRSCCGLRGHLVSITSEAENDFVTDTLMRGQVPDAWAGGFQPAGSPEPAGNWQWTTGEAWVYSNWRYLEPNNSLDRENALQIFAADIWCGKQWNDQADFVTIVAGYVVEYERLKSR